MGIHGSMKKRATISNGESLRRIHEGDEIWAGFKASVDIWWSGLRKYSKQTEQLVQKKWKFSIKVFDVPGVKK